MKTQLRSSWANNKYSESPGDREIKGYVAKKQRFWRAKESLKKRLKEVLQEALKKDHVDEQQKATIKKWLTALDK